MPSPTPQCPCARHRRPAAPPAGAAARHGLDEAAGGLDRGLALGIAGLGGAGRRRCATASLSCASRRWAGAKRRAWCWRAEAVSVVPSRLTLPSWSRPIAGAMRRPSVNSPAHSSRQRVRTSARVRWSGWGLAPLKRHAIAACGAAARAAGEHPGGRAVAPPRPPPRRGVGPRAGTGVSRHPLTPSARSDDRHHEPRQRVLGPGLLHRRREPVRRILIPLTQLAARRQTRAYDAPTLAACRTFPLPRGKHPGTLGPSILMGLCR